MKGGLLMDVSAALSAVGSVDALKQAVGLSLLRKGMDAQSAQTATMIQEFTNSQKQIAVSVTPHLGQHVDIRM
jgi:hypothetical protein